MGRFKICLAIDKEHRVLTARSAHGVSFGFLQPDLQFLLRDQALLTFILLRPGPLAPIVKLLAGDPSGLDPREAPLVFLAVGFESVIARLPERPLLQSADVAAALLPFRNGPLSILRADPPGLRKPACFPSLSFPGFRISVMDAVNSFSGSQLSYSAIRSMMCRC